MKARNKMSSSSFPLRIVSRTSYSSQTSFLLLVQLSLLLLFLGVLSTQAEQHPLKTPYHNKLGKVTTKQNGHKRQEKTTSRQHQQDDNETTNFDLKKITEHKAQYTNISSLPSSDKGRHVSKKTNNSSITKLLSSILSLFSNYFKRELTPSRLSRIGIYVGVYYLGLAIADVLKETLEGFDSNGAMSREDHDLPLFGQGDIISEGKSQTESAINITNHDQQHLLNNTNDNQGEKYHQKQRPHRALTRRQSYAKELLHKLHAAGLPFEKELNVYQQQQKSTAESVLRSLTRAEGRMLSQCLFVPEERGNNVWHCIGGLLDVKESLLDLLYLLRQQENNYNINHDNYYGGLLTNPSGILLYGPPGCGKTSLVRALSTTTPNIRCLIVTPSCLLRKYVGESNLNVRALFGLAQKLQPTILFIDEMDALFRERSDSTGVENEVSRDLKAEFMQLWDGINKSSSSSSNKIIIIGATNRPFDIDPAFLRRMPRSFFVGLPDYSGRMEILKKTLFGGSDGVGVPLDKNIFDLSQICRETEGYTPSDLCELLRTAALIPLREARMEWRRQTQEETASPTTLPKQTAAKTPQQLHPFAIRSLRTQDVLQAKQLVAPTQYSESYNRAMEEYIRRNHHHHQQQQNDNSNNYYPEYHQQQQQQNNNSYHHYDTLDFSSITEDNDDDYSDYSSDDDL